MKRSLSVMLVVAAVPGAVLGCDRAPAEPTPASSTGPTTTTARPAPLSWTLPPGWTAKKTAAHGKYRAKYEIPPVGDDKHPAEVLVQYLGRGTGADLDQQFERWRQQFENRTPERGTAAAFDVGGLDVRMLELAGTYRYAMGPPVGPQGRQIAHVLKPNWRGIAAAVDTPHRGRWWFRLVGPDDTVTSARSAMHEMLRSLR